MLTVWIIMQVNTFHGKNIPHVYANKELAQKAYRKFLRKEIKDNPNTKVSEFCKPVEYTLNW